VLSIFANCNATLATGFPCLLGGKLVSISSLMSNFATFAGDLALLFSVHCGKSS
jgi:hypothetical protein